MEGKLPPVSVCGWSRYVDAGTTVLEDASTSREYEFPWQVLSFFNRSRPIRTFTWRPVNSPDISKCLVKIQDKSTYSTKNVQWYYKVIRLQLVNLLTWLVGSGIVCPMTKLLTKTKLGRNMPAGRSMRADWKGHFWFSFAIFLLN